MGRFLTLLLLLPFMAEGAMTATDRGTGGNTTSQASTAMAPTSTIAAGSTGVLCISSDNSAGSAATNLPKNITDSVGNTWVMAVNVAGSAAANSSIELTTYVGHKLTTALTSSDNVTVTYTGANVPAKVWTFHEVTPGTAGNIALLTDHGTSSVATGTSTTKTLNSNLSIGGVAVGMTVGQSGTDSWTADSDTTNGTWSTQQHAVVGVAGAGVGITSQAKVQTTAASTQTYNTSNTSQEKAEGVLYFHEVGPSVKSLSAETTAATTWTYTPSSTIHAGTYAVLCLAMDNAGNLGASAAADAGPITDSAGNIWTQRSTGIYDNGSASAGAEYAIYTSTITSDLTYLPTQSSGASGGTIVFTWISGVSVTAKAAAIYEFTPSAGQAYSYIASAAAAGATTGTPTVTTSSITSGDIVIGMGAAESLDTWAGDADSSNGSWATMASASAGATAAAGMSITSQAKTTTGTATQTYNPTLTSADNIIAWVQIRSASGQSATNGFFR